MRVSDGRVLAVVNPKLACERQHPPGSIFKLVTMYAALQEECTRERESFTCGGQKKCGSVVMHCTVPNGHGRLDLTRALAQSCNVTFYDLGLRLGAEKLLSYASLFGLDRRCAGYGGRQSLGKLHARPVHPAETARLAIGQAPEFEITLLGAAQMTRTIALGKVDTTGGNMRCDKTSIAAVRRGMRAAVEFGTCKAAAVRDVAIAGKTGTPEAADDSSQRSAWFVGFAPYEEPEIVVVVFVERGHGYDTAAPIAGEIFSSYFGRDGK